MNPRNQRRQEEVQREIIESFASSQYPGDSRLLELDPKEDPDSREIFEKLEGKSWQELLSHLEQIDGPDLYWFCWIYTFLTPEAFYYYLPAFLIIALDLVRADVVGTDLLYFFMSSNESEDKSTERYVNEITCRSTPRQRTAIQNWARYMHDEYPEYPPTRRIQSWL